MWRPCFASRLASWEDRRKRKRKEREREEEGKMRLLIPQNQNPVLFNLSFLNWRVLKNLNRFEKSI
jgi:hypothetical protein